MTVKAVIDQYLDAGKKLTLLKGAVPYFKEWATQKVPPARLYAYEGNIALVLKKHDLVIDVDPRNGGAEGFAKLLADYKDHGFKDKLKPTVLTPRGGFHVYLNIAHPRIDRKLRTKVKDYPGIEFLTVGKTCTIPGSTMPDGTHTFYKKGKFKQDPAPPALLAMLEYDPKVTTDPSKYESSSDAEVLALLAKIDPSLNYDDWIKVGMAIHSHNPTPAGLDFWEQWSKPGINYKVGATAIHWGSFTSGAVTLGTLHFLAKDAETDATPDITPEERLQALLAKIPNLDKKQILEDFIPETAAMPIDKLDQGEIVKALQDRLLALTGVKPAVADIRNKMTPKKSYGVMAAPNWCNDWRYNDAARGWVYIKNMKVSGTESFNVKNNHRVPEHENGTRYTAANWVALHGYVEAVDAFAYLPFCKDLVFIDGDIRLLNSFNHATLPKQAESYSEAGIEAIERIKRHIMVVATTEEHYHILIQWVAHQVQNTGILLRWAPLIQSDEGAGKSFFASLLSACIGRDNVGTVRSNQVKSDYNGWATGVAVNVLEELSVKGHNRHEAVNALKPLITDLYFQVHFKNINAHQTRNTTNYIGLTNYKDCLPLASTDRRWWAISAPLITAKILNTLGATTVAGYFSQLFDDTREHGTEIRKFFMEYEISAEFKGYGVAPATVFKDSMIETEASGMEGSTEARELLGVGGYMYNEQALSSTHLARDLKDYYPEIDISTTKLNILLKRLNYSKVPRTPFQYKGERVDVWTKRPATPEQAKVLLEPNSEIKAEYGALNNPADDHVTH